MEVSSDICLGNIFSILKNSVLNFWRSPIYIFMGFTFCHIQKSLKIFSLIFIHVYKICLDQSLLLIPSPPVPPLFAQSLFSHICSFSLKKKLLNLFTASCKGIGEGAYNTLKNGQPLRAHIPEELTLPPQPAVICHQPLRQAWDWESVINTKS